jgi:hypothetical protein
MYCSIAVKKKANFLHYFCYLYAFYYPGWPYVPLADMDE